MKKFIIALSVVFVIIIGCKKIDEGNGGGLCACSPVVQPFYLNLVIKNTAGADLLNTNLATSFKQSDIQLYAKDASGVIKQISFNIAIPIVYGNEKLDYYRLVSQELAILAKSIDHTFYLKLGNQTPYEINLQTNSSLQKIEKLLIDKKEAPKETGKISTDLGLSLFYLTI